MLLSSIINLQTKLIYIPKSSRIYFGILPIWNKYSQLVRCWNISWICSTLTELRLLHFRACRLHLLAIRNFIPYANPQFSMTVFIGFFTALWMTMEWILRAKALWMTGICQNITLLPKMGEAVHRTDEGD